MSGRWGATCAAGAAVLWLACTGASAATLEVGPGKRFARIEEANARAKPGDVVLVYPLADGAAWFQRLYEKEPGLMKVVLIP